ncbi:unnamed protein product [Aphanomyces euteiches]
MAMLEAKNEQLIRQLMTMMKSTTQRAPELEDWIDDDPTPPRVKEAVYYNMTQRPGEHVKDYFVRLNAAAINIRLDYRRSRSILDDHIDRFANSLLDTALGTVIRQQQFVSIDNLESYLDRQLANDTKTKFRADALPPKQNAGTIPINDRVKAKKSNVQFMDEGPDSPRMPLSYASPSYASPPYFWSDQYQAEIYARGRNNSMAKRIHCGECGREHYSIDGREHYSIDGQCWSNVFCTMCNKMGHPESNCFKACAICTPPHNKYDRCEKRERVAELKEFLEAHAIEGMPSLDCLKF